MLIQSSRSIPLYASRSVEERGLITVDQLHVEQSDKYPIPLNPEAAGGDVRVVFFDSPAECRAFIAGVTSLSSDDVTCFWAEVGGGAVVVSHDSDSDWDRIAFFEQEATSQVESAAATLAAS